MRDPYWRYKQKGSKDPTWADVFFLFGLALCFSPAIFIGLPIALIAGIVVICNNS